MPKSLPKQWITRLPPLPPKDTAITTIKSAYLRSVVSGTVFDIMVSTVQNVVKRSISRLKIKMLNIKSVEEALNAVREAKLELKIARFVERQAKKFIEKNESKNTQKES